MGWRYNFINLGFEKIRFISIYWFKITNKSLLSLNISSQWNKKCFFSLNYKCGLKEKADYRSLYVKSESTQEKEYKNIAQKKLDSYIMNYQSIN